jgi:hypothetical protein
LALIVRVLDADAASWLTARLGWTLVGDVTTAIAVADAGVVAVAGAAVALSAARVLAAVHRGGRVGTCADFAAIGAYLEAVATGNLAQNRLAALRLYTDSATVGATVVVVAVVAWIVHTLKTGGALDSSEAATDWRWRLTGAIVTNTGTGGVGQAAIGVSLSIAAADRRENLSACVGRVGADATGIGPATDCRVFEVAVFAGVACVAQPTATCGLLGGVADCNFVVAAIAVVGAVVVAIAAAFGLAATCVLACVGEVVSLSQGTAIWVGLEI